MLIIECPANTLWNEQTEEFIESPKCTLKLEHSLLSISKWESIHKKPFLSAETKTREETISYVECMTINHDVPPTVYIALTDEIITQINSYIEDSHTATTISKRGGGRASREIITSELIYYWMVSQGIPFECEKWNLNRLMTLIEVCAVKSTPEKKMSKQSILAQNRALNQARRAKTGSKG